ncbi:hypothetical protein AB6A40_005868 [Gnathostoma spinigerum]|uniref:Uncharacterized protein n=1 Tax=Gnathostoma spinigerum TaxID=75299 RepID=A0ABD6EPC2_9BILA
MTVFAGCHKEESVVAIRSECKTLPGTLVAFQLDISSDKSVDDAKHLVETKLFEMNQDLYAVVNNAGASGVNFYDEFLSLADYRDVMEVNFYGVLRVTKAFLHLIKASRGRIITCLTGFCFVKFPGIAPYSASKTAVHAYCEVLRTEMRQFGVKVVTIFPGTFQTPIADPERVINFVKMAWNNADELLKEQYGEKWINQVCEIVRRYGEAGDKDISWVVNDYFHAITAKYPSDNYVEGIDATLYFTPYFYLPNILKQLLMDAYFWVLHVPKPACLEK